MHGSWGSGALIHEVFAHQVAQYPEAIAVEYGDTRLDYAETAARADPVAAVLRGMGVGPGTPVGVFLPRSAELVIAQLGVLQAGGAYVPLDPGQPDRWIADQLRIAEVHIVIASAADLPRIPDSVDTLVFDELRTPLLDEPAGIETSPDDLAYIMFTSGSTGRPKAVAVPHRGVVNLLTDQKYVAMGPGQCQLFYSAPTFDMATFAIWGPLLNGGRLAIAPPDSSSPGELARLIRAHAVTTVYIPTTICQVLLEEHPEALRPLRQLVTGGETVFPATLDLARRELPDTTTIVIYGPTEATVIATSYTQSPDTPIPAVPVIGTAIENVETYILDEYLDPVPDGESGELCLAGPGLAWGYLGAPEVTATRFAPDPHGARGTRMYRTGDRVRRTEHGGMEFIGRMDNQIKLRGRRIEPAEVEQALLMHPDIVTAYVTKEHNTLRGSYLAAYVTARAGVAISRSELERYMETTVADHLRPDIYVVRESAPLTPHGKMDRRRLLDGAEPQNSRPADTRRTTVVVNEDEQYGMWPDGRPVPSGWRTVFGPGTLDECSSYLRRTWTDIRPAHLGRR
ncbi:amino acid adenylation domain-containing protein [Nocardia sienata]|uniref:amino acid adenylation domain-containing protein n=1 Tax=Nocardia sienata TaxID=248552 RepID=UPI0007A554EF|nr:amino acid adenylation domain-containing protein [Nocardia sienata]